MKTIDFSIGMLEMLPLISVFGPSPSEFLLARLPNVEAWNGDRYTAANSQYS
jgi:hypothetical protein